MAKDARPCTEQCSTRASNGGVMTTADFRSKMMAAYMMRDHHEEWWIVWIYVHAPIRWEVGGELWEVIREALQGI
jgi:hypothetical protein